MNISCPFCEHSTELEEITQREQVQIRGETLDINRPYYRCLNCNEEFEVHTDERDDPFDAAYREYRKRKGWLQPEDIKSFRESLSLTQQQFSHLVGIGIATLNRYENGALQTAAHQNLLSFVVAEPKLLLESLQHKPNLFTDSERDHLINKLDELDQPNDLLVNDIIQRFASYEASVLSGGKTFEINKLLQTFKFFCYERPVYKTKLNKLMFYADFLHFRDYGSSITGLRYAHATFGPVPDKFTTWLEVCSTWMNELQANELITEDCEGETFLSLSYPDLNAFLPSEISALHKIKERFRSYSSKQITEYSHQEVGYMNTRLGELIPYNYAEELRI